MKKVHEMCIFSSTIYDGTSDLQKGWSQLFCCPQYCAMNSSFYSLHLAFVASSELQYHFAAEPQMG
jgi:hypothetical protein